MAKIKVRVPATIANLGPGFDVLGMAVQFYNYVEIEASVVKKIKKDRSNKKPEIIVEGEGKQDIPVNEKNIVYQAIKKVADRCNRSFLNLRITLTNNIPLARGLGSSAAARIGGIVAANRLCGDELSENDVLKTAYELEGHPDNVVPALLGGLVICCKNNGKSIKKVNSSKERFITKDGEIRWINLDPPVKLYVVVCYPDFQMSTSKAREILPKKVSLNDAVFTSSRLAMLIAAIEEGRYDLIGMCMEDRLHQDVREEKFMPYISDVINNAKASGALGASLSGSGSAIASLFQAAKKRVEKKGNKIGRAMQKAFKKHGHKSKFSVLWIDGKGACV